MPTPQTVHTHARLDPKFHFVTMPLLLLCVIASLVHVWEQPTPPNVLLVPLSIAALLTAAITRLYAMKVQDRVIRLEEAFRMSRLGLSQDGLSMRQIIALRFASDDELATLSARAKAENLTSKQIKEAILTWRPDYDRV